MGDTLPIPIEHVGHCMKRAGIVVVLACAGSLLTPAQDDAGSPAEAQVFALEKAWSQAAEHADAKTLQALLDSTLVYIDDDGILMEKSQFVESMRLPSHPVHKAYPGTI